MCALAIRLLAITWIALALLPPPALGQETLTVFAAASLKNALDDVDREFAKAAGSKVTASYAAASTAGPGPAGWRSICSGSASRSAGGDWAPAC